MNTPLTLRRSMVSSWCALFMIAGCSAADALPEAVDEDGMERGAFANRTLFVEDTSNASRQADAWRVSDPDSAAVMDQLATIPVSLWIGDWNANVRITVDDAVTRAGAALQVLTLYNIPNRDCGAWSAGGVSDRAGYADWIDEVAAGLDGRRALVILEPDALALDDCLDAAGVTERNGMLSDAVDTLTAAGAAVYLDAGDSAWIPADEMADRLLDAGVERAAGFALNVSHTETSADEASYARELRAIVGTGARYVIDTSRNGLGPTADHEWCNPLGRANGRRHTLRTRTEGLDALLWIKRPGESDGQCNGGPSAGTWWPDYALDLALNTGL